MHKKALVIFLIALAFSNLAMARQAQYDEEARNEERLEKQRKDWEKTNKSRQPVKQFAGGIKQATVDSTTGFIGDTAEGTTEDAPIVGTLEGARVGSGKVLDNTVKGAVKVATLGYGSVDSYEVQEPEKGTNEPTKIKIKIPGS